VFITYDADENDVSRVYESVYELLSWADEAVAQRQNDPDLEVNANSFDWLEGLANTCQVPGTQTSSGSPAGPALGCSLKRQANLVHHIDLRWTVGVRGAEASRIDITGRRRPGWAGRRIDQDILLSRPHGGDAPQLSALRAARAPTGIHLEGGIQ
jgi:hypothetical protein